MTETEPWFAVLLAEAEIPAGGEIALPVEITVDLAKGREFYREYVADVEWYRDHEQLDPDHPDKGYATGVPYTEEEYLRDYIGGVLSDQLGDSRWHSFRRAENSQPKPD